MRPAAINPMAVDTIMVLVFYSNDDYGLCAYMS